MRCETTGVYFVKSCCRTIHENRILGILGEIVVKKLGLKVVLNDMVFAEVTNLFPLGAQPTFSPKPSSILDVGLIQIGASKIWWFTQRKEVLHFKF